MPNKFVVSDTHFGHENIIKYCKRPYDNVNDMNESIRSKWNSIVGPDDIVYHLGDVYFGKWFAARGLKPYEFLSTLNGRKKLVLGNHDSGLDQNLHRIFENIEAWYKLPNLGMILSHMPLHPSQLGDKFKKNVHGHIHNAYEIDDPRYINVSVECINYEPVNLDKFI